MEKSLETMKEKVEEQLKNSMEINEVLEQEVKTQKEEVENQKTQLGEKDDEIENQKAQLGSHISISNENAYCSNRWVRWGG